MVAPHAALLGLVSISADNDAVSVEELGLDRADLHFSHAGLLQSRSAPSTGTPDRMNFDNVVLGVVKVVHVAASFLHQDPLNQLPSGAAVTLADAGRRGDLPEHLLELCYEEPLRVTVFAPPAIFGFEPLLGLIEKDDLHDALDTAPSTPTRPSLGPRQSRRGPDQKTCAARRALRRSARRRSPGLRLPLRPASRWAHPRRAVRSSLESCVHACLRSYRVSH